MDKNNLEGLLKAGISRFYSEGFICWSKADVMGAINPRGEKHDLQEPLVQGVLKDLEAQGLIKIIGRDDFYLEILREA